MFFSGLVAYLRLVTLPFHCHARHEPRALCRIINAGTKIRKEHYEAQRQSLMSCCSIYQESITLYNTSDLLELLLFRLRLSWQSAFAPICLDLMYLLHHTRWLK